MFGTMPGYGGMGRPPPDPRRGVALAIALAVVFFCLPLFVEATSPWARAFIARNYSRAYMEWFMGGYWVVAGLAMLSLTRLTIWYGAGIGVALVARSLSRAR